MKMSSSYGVSFTYEDIVKRIAAETEGEEYRPYRDAFEHFQLNSACDFIWKLIQTADEKIQNTQPFKLIKTDREKALADVGELVVDLYRVAYLLRPLLPGTSSAIMDAIKHNVMPPSLFPRQD
jgi:methionyl-tRNA synthetase